MFELLASVFISQAQFSEDPEHLHAKAEERTPPQYLDLAKGRLNKRARKSEAWPVEKVLSIGNTGGMYQNYSWDPYFHHGLDIRADAGSTVRASRGGKVVNIENYEPGVAAYWEIAILDDEGFLWQYHHVDHDSIPQAVLDAFENGGRVETGDKIGEVFYWPITSFGERYHHIHLNILGVNKEYLSPFLFLETLEDHSAPVFAKVGVLKDGEAVSEDRVAGPYSLYAQIDDLILSKVFANPPHEIRVSIDGGASRTVWNFDKLPGGGDISAHVHDFYVSSMVCGNYQCRKPVVNLGFTLEGKLPFPQAKGTHQVEITARDFNGNQTEKSYSWTVD